MLGSRIDWCNENEDRNYPLSETATAVDDNGNVIARDIIADMGLVLPAVYADARLASLYISSQIVSVVIGSATGGLLLGSYARSGIEPYKAYPLTPIVADASGWISFGDFTVTTATNHRLSTPAQGGVERRCIRVAPAPGVKSFRGLGNAESIDGIVALQASPELEIVRHPSNSSRIIVRLRGDSRYMFSEACQRQANTPDCGLPVVRRINNVGADSSGIITLRFV